MLAVTYLYFSDLVLIFWLLLLWHIKDVFTNGQVNCKFVVNRMRSTKLLYLLVVFISAINNMAMGQAGLGYIFNNPLFDNAVFRQMKLCALKSSLCRMKADGGSGFDYGSTIKTAESLNGGSLFVTNNIPAQLSAGKQLRSIRRSSKKRQLDYNVISK